jgi:hypothetical protein
MLEKAGIRFESNLYPLGEQIFCDFVQFLEITFKMERLPGVLLYQISNYSDVNSILVLELLSATI